MLTDALEQAKDFFGTAHSEARFKAKKINLPGGRSIFEIDELAALSQAAASIAIAEELRGIKAILCNATTLDGAIKIDGGEQAKRSADALNSIDIALSNASGANGALKVIVDILES